MSQYDELHQLLITRITYNLEVFRITGQNPIHLQFVDALLGFTERVARLKTEEGYQGPPLQCCVPQPAPSNPAESEETETPVNVTETSGAPVAENVTEVPDEAKAKRTRKPRAATEPAAVDPPAVEQPAAPVETPPGPTPEPAEPAAPVVHDDIRKVFHQIKAAVIAAHPIANDDAGVPNGPQRATQDAAVAALVAKGKEILKSFDASNIDQLKAEDLPKAFAALSALK